MADLTDRSPRRALKDEDWRVRLKAAAVLGRIGGVGSVEPLIGALEDEMPAVRSVAARALGRIGDTRAVESLSVALADNEDSVRDAAKESLARVADWERCTDCGETTLPATFEKNHGLCDKCATKAASSPRSQHASAASYLHDRLRLHLVCRGCRREGVLGEDAFVTTPESTASLVGHWLGDPPSQPQQLSNDIVSFMPSERRHNRKSITGDDRNREIVMTALSSPQGKWRKWTCYDCGEIQGYPEI